MTYFSEGVRLGKRLRKNSLSPQERTRLSAVYSRQRFRAGLEILGEVAQIFRTEYTSEEQFRTSSDYMPQTDDLEPDDIHWQNPFCWQRGCYIMPVRCRLFLRSKAGGPSLVIGCRQRWLRGNPPVDIEHLADEADTVFQAFEFTPSGEANSDARPALASSATLLEQNKPGQNNGDFSMIEFCVASATHSGCPVMVPEVFTDAERHGVVRALARDVRRVA